MVKMYTVKIRTSNVKKRIQKRKKVFLEKSSSGKVNG